jgi:2-hydroxycyclohexanecarboxyl-CoA dehydrogenase
MASGISRLKDKVAIVTGAAQGIGRAIATRLAAEGAAVAIADVQVETAQKTAGEIQSTGAKVIAVKFDVTKFEDATAATATVERELGPIDILVNNAGWDKLEPFVNSAPETWEKIIAINYRGVLNCCRVIAPKMQARGSGKIVSIASDAGRVGSTGEAVYSG